MSNHKDFKVVQHHLLRDARSKDMQTKITFKI